jgi:predicted DNA-binding transcriptional regulator AlpA
VEFIGLAGVRPRGVCVSSSPEAQAKEHDAMTTESMNNHIPQVKAVTGLSRSMIYALVSIDRFPQPVKISDRSQYKYSLITKINFG